jgi:hypothetical protein
VYEYLTEPPKTNDLLVVEVNGKLIPMRPNAPTPQVFIVTGDPDSDGSIPLKPFNSQTHRRKVWAYRAGFQI